MPVHHIPDGYHSVIPYLIIDGAARAIDFYKEAFGATEVMRMEDPSGKVGHAELRIGDAHIMLADEYPDLGFRGPGAVGGTPVIIMIYVENADICFQAAISRGAKEIKPLADQFYGDRSGTLTDPFGHIWTVATHVEDLSPEEMERRAKEYEQQGE
ncbi:MAG TPA: VOC family protein [Thermoanaerobaculia bacterium]